MPVNLYTELILSNQKLFLVFQNTSRTVAHEAKRPYIIYDITTIT